MNDHNPAQNLTIANRILAALPPSEYQRILPKLEEVPLLVDEQLVDFGDTMHYVYFPSSGIISLLATVDNDSTLIACIVGNEGMHGIPLYLGMKTAPVRAIVQVGGTAMRMRANDFEKECRSGGELPDIVRRFVLSVLVQILQSTVCYRYHSVENRLARWLLMTGDRMESNEFQMTQSYLSNMVGVRRETVTASAGSLKRKKLITYSRGGMRIIDRRGLEGASCTCYAVIRGAEKRISG